MATPPNIGGPFALAAQYKVSESRQAGIRPRPETPNVGGPLVIKPEYEMVAIAQKRTQGVPFETGTSISVKTDVL